MGLKPQREKERERERIRIRMSMSSWELRRALKGKAMLVLDLEK